MKDNGAAQGRDGPPVFAKPHVIRAEMPNGDVILSSGHDLPEAERAIGDWLVKWAAERPDQTYLAERNAADDGWLTLSYAQSLERVEALAGGLLVIGASPERPVAILSGNGIDHAILSLAAMHVGVPSVAISPAYSLLSSDHAKLKSMVELLDPSLIYIADPGPFGPALNALEGLHRAKIVTSRPGAQTAAPLSNLAELARPELAGRAREAFAALTPDTVARLLFTSGSTGKPKAVINTHRMLTSNQAAIRTLWPFVTAQPPVLVDWLPWSHTFGANYTSFLALSNGGTQYIDNGKPAPGLIGLTIRNIKEIRPNLAFNVPHGYDMISQAMEEDAELRAAFFGMTLAMNAGAALPSTVWDRLIAMSRREIGRVMPIVSAWGSTETAPLATLCHYQAPATGNIGVPAPGTSLKLTPNGEKLEIRVKGPNVTPGYFRNPEMTAAAFDADGFYIMGDAVRLADPDAPEKGLLFDGRVSEDFKLDTGTWVSVGAIRIAGIDALAPVAQDIVVTGHDRDAVGFLVFPNEKACRALSGLGEDARLSEVLAHPAIRNHVQAGLAKLKETGGGSSRYATRARFLMTPASPDRGEITDKAYLNQRQVLANRTDEVAALYGDDATAFIALV